jgi:hypothetical protein
VAPNRAVDLITDRRDDRDPFRVTGGVGGGDQNGDPDRDRDYDPKTERQAVTLCVNNVVKTPTCQRNS